MKPGHGLQAIVGQPRRPAKSDSRADAPRPCFARKGRLGDRFQSFRRRSTSTCPDSARSGGAGGTNRIRAAARKEVSAPATVYAAVPWRVKGSVSDSAEARPYSEPRALRQRSCPGRGARGPPTTREQAPLQPALGSRSAGCDGRPWGGVRASVQATAGDRHLTAVAGDSLSQNRIPKSTARLEATSEASGTTSHGVGCWWARATDLSEVQTSGAHRLPRGFALRGPFHARPGVALAPTLPSSAGWRRRRAFELDLGSGDCWYRNCWYRNRSKRGRRAPRFNSD